MTFKNDINIDLNVAELLILIDGLDYVIADLKKSNVDRAFAEKTRQRLVCIKDKKGLVPHGD